MQQRQFFTALTLSAFLLLAGLSFLSPVSVAQNNTRVEQGQITLALDNADIRDLIQWAQEVTPKSIILHPNVKGKVTVMSGAPMREGEAYEVFLSALQVPGFAVIENANVITVIPAARAKQSSVPLAQDSRPGTP